jgi:hypothetical protein
MSLRVKNAKSPMFVVSLTGLRVQGGEIPSIASLITNPTKPGKTREPVALQRSGVFSGFPGYSGVLWGFLGFAGVPSKHDQTKRNKMERFLLKTERPCLPLLPWRPSVNASGFPAVPASPCSFSIASICVHSRLDLMTPLQGEIFVAGSARRPSIPWWSVRGTFFCWEQKKGMHR